MGTKEWFDETAGEFSHLKSDIYSLLSECGFVVQQRRRMYGGFFNSQTPTLS